MQREIISCVLAGRDVMALLPTGGGKSLCYQVPALAQDGCCIVISPLIALMQDQVQRLGQQHIPAAALHAGMPAAEVKNHLENLVQGAYKLFYISPERIQSDLFNEYLPDVPVNFFAVDEAHCISQWGHDFRPDYLKIASLKKTFSDLPFIALTATATHTTRQDIIKQLRLKKPALFQQSFKKPNLWYTVQPSENKLQDTLHALSPQATALIYCRSRKQTELLAKTLTGQQLPTLCYHAGMEREQRNQAQQMWMKDEVRAMAATTAFGMGIDKPDVKTVLHYDAPEHLEAYYQEAGRAGRGLEKASAVLLCNKRDIDRLRESTDIKFPGEEYLRLVYQSVCEYLQLPIGSAPGAYFDFDLLDFCQKFRLTPAPAYAALKLLEQEGLWTLSEAVYKPTTVQFIADRRVIDTLADSHPLQGNLCIQLLRMYSAIYHYPATISIGQVGKRCKMSHAEVERHLEQLQQMQIIRFQKASDKPQLYIHHLRVDSRHLLLNMRRIALLRERHRERTEKMIYFLQNTTVCREKLLLDYFGEKTETPCGHCDVCLQNAAPSLSDGEIRTRLIGLLSQKDLPLSTLLQSFSNPTDRDHAIAILRKLMDEEKILREGNLYRHAPH